MSEKYANIELTIKSESLLSLGNSVNYKQTANWNHTINGNVTSVSGLNNGNPSSYGLYDTFGQLYEWTETSDLTYPQQKIIRGGSYVDQSERELRAIKKFLWSDILSEGCFGFRVCSYINPNSLNNFVQVLGNINDSNNDTGMYDDCSFNNLDMSTYVDPKTLNNIGVVQYNFTISKYLVTNQEYCNYLNSVDANGTNKEIFDDRMESSNVGGIRIKKSYENASTNNYYIVKLDMGNKPVSFITWDKAAKYCNWLSNGSLNNISSTICGSYNMNPVEYIDLVSNVSLTVAEKAVLLSGNPGIVNIFVDGQELQLGNKILLKNEDLELEYNGIYTVVANTNVTNSNQYPFYLERDLSYTLGGQVFKAKKGNINKNKLFQVGDSCEQITYNVNYGVSEQEIKVYSDHIFTRSNNAKYFLPTNNEWHKAALYDFSLNKYWKYSTQSDETPLSVICDEQGDAVYPEGYFYTSEKTFPIIIKKGPLIPPAPTLPPGTTIEPTPEPTPTQPPFVVQRLGLSSDMSYYSTPDSFQEYVYFVNVDISGVKADTEYFYEFKSGPNTNWPAHIYPLSGIFTPKNDGVYLLENRLKFCPISRLDSDDIVCNNNLYFDLNNSSSSINPADEQGKGLLDLEIYISGDNKIITNSISIESLIFPIIPKNETIEIKIQTPTETPNSIEVHNNYCHQYIPIVAIASTGNTHTKIGQKYNYEFFTNNTNVSIVPESGTFFISKPHTKITSILRLNGEENCQLGIKCLLNDQSEELAIYDYVTVMCKKRCVENIIINPDPSVSPGPNPAPPTPTPSASVVPLTPYTIKIYNTNDTTRSNILIEKTTENKYIIFSLSEFAPFIRYTAYVSIRGGSEITDLWVDGDGVSFSWKHDRTNISSEQREANVVIFPKTSRPTYSNTVSANYRSLTRENNILSIKRTAGDDRLGNVWRWCENGRMWGGSFNSNYFDLTFNGMRTADNLPPTNERGLALFMGRSNNSDINLDDLRQLGLIGEFSQNLGQGVYPGFSTSGKPLIVANLEEAAAYCNTKNIEQNRGPSYEIISSDEIIRIPYDDTLVRILIPNFQELEAFYERLSLGSLTDGTSVSTNLIVPIPPNPVIVGWTYANYSNYPQPATIFDNGLGPYPEISNQGLYQFID